MQELQSRNPIEDVVGSYVKLTRRSGANLFGLCPFHSEKTPSFSVSPDKQIYHCFGCGKGGSAINFIMEIENLSFSDAVEFLARRSGMEVPNDGGDNEVRNRRERLLALNKEAARWFFTQLSAPEGQPGRDYIAQRQITPAFVKNFGLGYAPDGFYALTDAMHEKGYQDYELIDAGLANANRSGKGVHDIFRSRLMFPVIDVRGNVLGFSGRTLVGDERKYLNTRETPVFNKSRVLFGLNLAKKTKSGYILLTEGNIDVVSLHQAGFDSAVASLGTSLTPDQARLISRYVKEVIIAYDNDGAGQKAAKRAIEILRPLDLSVRVLQMEGAKDPDEFIKAKGRDAFANLLSGSENHVKYQLARAADGKDLESDEGRVAFLKEAAAIIAGLPNSVEREIYAMRAAETAGVSKAAVLSETEHLRKQRAAAARKQAERDNLRSVTQSVQPRSRALKYENPASAVAEEGVIRLLYTDPALLDGTDLRPEEFSSPMLGRLYQILREKTAGQQDVPSIASLSQDFDADEMNHISGLLQEQFNGDREQALRDFIRFIRRQRENTAGNIDLRALIDNKKKYEEKGTVDKNG